MKTTAIIGRLAAWALSDLILSACSRKQGGDAAGDKGGKPGGRTIALLLPESKTARYGSKDHPFFEAKAKALCPDCQVLTSNANQDASQRKAETTRR
ncbi:hypothetical protein WMF45_00470 [Sorangium sp. So ce448]|uniref:hypothetical protein n=1 Tax=Sorangium sp. So ce448 TaxID=3133314 RepID=UPI003F6415D9